MFGKNLLKISVIIFALVLSNEVVAQVPAISVDANGNVGVGTQTPGAKLDVRGAVNIAGVVSAQDPSPSSPSNLVTVQYLNGIIQQQNSTINNLNNKLTNLNSVIATLQNRVTNLENNQAVNPPAPVPIIPPMNPPISYNPKYGPRFGPMQGGY